MKQQQRSDNLASSLTECIDQMTSTPRCEALVDERLEIREAAEDYDPEDDWYNDDAVAFLALAYELEDSLSGCREQTIEQCAALCTRMAEAWNAPFAEECAAAIRALKWRATDLGGGQDSQIGAEEK